MTERQGETFVMNESAGLSFSAFLLGLASTALIHLGVTPDPEKGVASADLTSARQSIDVLVLLHEKTKGNLTPEEESLFQAILTDLRVRFVQSSSNRSA